METCIVYTHARWRLITDWQEDVRIKSPQCMCTRTIAAARHHLKTSRFFQVQVLYDGVPRLKERLKLHLSSMYASM